MPQNLPNNNSMDAVGHAEDSNETLNSDFVFSQHFVVGRLKGKLKVH